MAEILPLESADYHYIAQGEKSYFYSYSLSSDAVKDYDEEIKYIPCWSLAALLGVLPNYILQTNTDGTVFVFCESKRPMFTKSYDNPVDACVEMIIKLYELKQL